METLEPIIWSIISTAAIIIIYVTIRLLKKFFSSPFKYPYHEINFDVTGKRNPDINNYIDQYLITYKLLPFDEAIKHLNNWKQKSLIKANKSLFKKLRYKQYIQSLDDDNLFVFVFLRDVTKYKQTDYVKESYKEKHASQKYCCSYDYIIERYNKLKAINFEDTLSNYNSNEQRKLMTKELREYIAKRDHYTCQICGKYMPDGVGLHIDHIIPISKGGKSIASNLQVLCSKCNGRKSNK